MKTVQKSAKLANVLYDIRGPIMDAAKQMEEEGQKIIKLNLGNLAVFGFDAPEEIQQDMIRNLPASAGYSDSKGIFGARKAVMHETQKQGIKGVVLDDIYLGNGASELIAMATNALLDDGDARVAAATTQLDLGGGTLLPGFIDVQVNGGGGVLFNNSTDVEALRRIGQDRVAQRRRQCRIGSGRSECSAARSSEHRHRREQQLHRTR